MGVGITLLSRSRSRRRSNRGHDRRIWGLRSLTLLRLLLRVYGYQAGKTFQTKQILRFLAYVAGGAGDDYADQLLSTTPILEG